VGCSWSRSEAAEADGRVFAWRRRRGRSLEGGRKRAREGGREGGREGESEGDDGKKADGRVLAREEKEEGSKPEGGREE